MPSTDRQNKIVSLINERSFMSVNDLVKEFQVSSMTIRRDLERLSEQKRIQRTFGGAAPVPATQDGLPSNDSLSFSAKPEGKLVDRVDVLVASSVNARYDTLLIDRCSKKGIPVIAESLWLPGTKSVVAIDNQAAALELGRWAGSYALQNWGGRAVILDLTYQLSNTQIRSRSFIQGVKEVVPNAVERLSLNAQSRFETAHQLTKDALTVHHDINIIFAINDITALGAMQACLDLEIDPHDLLVMPFGLEGDTFKDALIAGTYCRAGLAMFPEIVGPVCVEAAVRAYNGETLSENLETPSQVITAETLPDWYIHTEDGWKPRIEVICGNLIMPLEIEPCDNLKNRNLPQRIGFIVPFMEHEWYQNLAKTMDEYARQLNIQIEIVDVDQDLADELEQRRRRIASQAASLIQEGEVILVDEGLLGIFLAEELKSKSNITVITNSVQVFDILRSNPDIVLISTGGAYRRSSQVMVGPTAEGALRELRADRLFLTVAGISFNFGLSHTNVSEVTLKQAMIRSAREVILLADHTYFGQESTIQVAPLNVVHQLITDDALPASTRLDLSEAGILVTLAVM